MEATASTRLSSRTLQSGTVSPAVLQKKVSDAESLISNTKNFTKILSDFLSIFEVANMLVTSGLF